MCKKMRKDVVLTGKDVKDEPMCEKMPKDVEGRQGGRVKRG
jgi:hypothetical protein